MATLYLSDVINDLLNALSSERVKAEVIVNNMNNSTQKLTEVSNQLFTRLIDESNEPIDNVPIQIGNHLINPNELLLQTNFENEDFIINKIPVNDYNTGNKVEVSIEDVVQSVRENIKANKLYTSVYDMASNDFNNTTLVNQSLFNEVNDALGGDLNATEVTNIVNQLCNKDLSLNDRIKIAHEVTGFGAIIDDSINDPTIQRCALSNYTGIKPYTMMLNALDIDVNFPEFKVNSPSDIASTVIDAHKWVHQTRKKVLKATGRAIKKGLKWLSRKAKKTYSNPSDFTLNGDTVYSLEETVNYMCNNPGGYEWNNWHEYFNLRDPGTPVVFDVLGAEYKIVRTVDPRYEDLTRLIISRRLCPQNYSSVISQINETSNYFINTTTGSLTGINDINDIVNILSCLSSVQYLDKSMDEKDLYNSLWIQAIGSELTLTVLTYLLKTLESIGDVEWNQVPNYENTTIAFKSMLSVLFHDENAVSINTVSTIDCEGNLITITLPSNQSGGTITNKHLIDLISTSLELTSTTQSAKYYDDMQFTNLSSTSISNEYGYENMSNYCPVIIMLLYYLDDVFAETSNGNVFLPYSHHETNEINVSIRTDAENLNAAVKTTIGIIAAVAVTLTSIKLAPKLISFKKDLQMKSMSISNLTMSAGDKYLSGDISGAQADLKKARKYKRITGLFGVQDNYANVNESLMLSQLMNKIA